MDYPKRMKDDVKRHYRSRATLEQRAEKEIKKSCDRYHAWCDTQKALNQKPLTIIAEGDSWFRYVIGKAIIFQLGKLLKLEIQNLASPGDEVNEMLAPKQLMRLATLLKRGPAQGWKYDCMLFSGGGNDLVGRDRFHHWLHPYKAGMTPAQVINKKTLNAKLSLIAADYQELIDLRDKNSAKTHLFFHAYDFVIPDGRRACWLGPWLEPGLSLRKVPKSKRREVVKLLLTEFDRVLDKLANTNQRVTVIQTQGVLSDDEWANELHPTNHGFRNIAKVFESEIKKKLQLN